MVKVAVAGGSGGIGRHIVEAILATHSHTVVVLSRSSSNPSLSLLGAEIVAVDYTSHASLLSALEGVHTVISTISSPNDPDEFVNSQVALIRASIDAGVMRFAPSEFAIRGIHGDPMRYYAYKAKVVDALKETDLEWTIYENGLFMNYFASGTDRGVGHLQPLKFVVDVENAKATLVGDGNVPVMFTRGEGVGAFVAASLDLEKWPELSGMAGDKKTYNQVIDLAQKIRGCKFDVTYISEDTYRAQMNQNPTHIMENFYQESMLEIAKGERCTFETNLNALLPDVKPMGVVEFLATWWGGQEK